MPKCSNDQTKSYTGKEENPKGLGFSASGENIGTIMKGKDGNDYIVKGTETNKKWILLKEGLTSSKKTISESDNDTISTISTLNNYSSKCEINTKNIMVDFNKVKKEDVFDLTSAEQELVQVEKIYGIWLLKKNKQFADYEEFYNKLCQYKYNKPSNTLANFFLSSVVHYDKDCLFTDVYIPIVSETPIELEFGDEPKFGGEIPYFIEGETWPEYVSNGLKKPFDFVFQYMDPLNPGMMARVFLPLSSYEHMKKGLCHISHIDYDKDSKKRIIIKKPETVVLQPFRIESMKTKSELKSFEYIEKKYNISPDKYNNLYDDFYESYFNDFNESPYAGIKIGGTKVFSAYSTVLDDFNESEIQLTESKFFIYSFGESGIVHICLNEKDEYVFYLNDS